MNPNYSPNRIVVLHVLKNPTLALTSVDNALKNGKYQINKCLIISENIKLSEKLFHNILLTQSVDVSYLEIPNMNGLLTENIQYVPENNDVILIPFGSQFHLGKMLTKVSTAMLNNEISFFYLCHTKPEGLTTDWYAVQIEKGNVRSRKMEIERNTSDKLSWIFSGERIQYSRIDFDIPKREFHKFIELESDDDLSKQEIESTMLEISRPYTKEIRPPFLFEMFAAKALSFLSQTTDIIMNIKFDANWKSKNFDDVIFREEDIIVLTNNAKLIYISCKFLLGSSKKNCKMTIKKEIVRMNNLKLRVNFPEERISKLIITSTKAKTLFDDYIDEVFISDLSGVLNVIETINQIE